MWFLGNKADKAKLQGHKAVVIFGHRFVIRKVNPLIDFREDNMPQIFAHSLPRRKQPAEPAPGSAEKALKRVADDMRAMILAGLVEPELVAAGNGDKRGQEDGITVEDILRQEDTATRLYWEIIAHSLNKFRGLKGVFFSLRLRYALLTAWPRDTESSHMKSSSNQEVSA